MAEISVNTGSMKIQENNLQNIINRLGNIESELDNVNNKIAIYLSSAAYWNIKQKISQTSGRISQNKQLVQSLKTVLGNSRELYQNTEEKSADYFAKGSNVNWSQTGGFTEWIKSKNSNGVTTTINVKTWSTGFEEYWNKLIKDGEAKDALYEAAIGTSGAGLFGIGYSSKDTIKLLDVSTKLENKSKWSKKDGDFAVDYKVSGEIKGGMLKHEEQYGIFSSETELDAFKASGSAGIFCALFDKGKFTPGIGVEGEIGGSVLSGKQKYKAGTDDVNVSLTATGSALSAEAKGSAKAGMIKRNGSYVFGVEAKGEAGAYLAKGEIKGGFEVFGVKFGTKIKGSIGAGAEGEIKTSADGLKIGAGLSAILGAGLELEIDWSECSKKINSLFEGNFSQGGGKGNGKGNIGGR